MNDDLIRSRTKTLLEPLLKRPGILLEALHAIQEEFTYIPSASVAVAATLLNLSRAEVHGVVSFYSDFRTAPGGRQTLYICRAESCQAMGSEQLEEVAKKQLGIDYHQSTDDGRLSLEPVYCLGNCACSPAIMLDETLYSKVTPERLRELLEATL